MTDRHDPSRPRLRVACIVGTRPEAVKMAPVILALREAAWAETIVVATAQHRHLLDQVLALFGIKPDVDLDLMRPGQSLPDLTARIVTGLDAAFDDIRPDIVLAQGDTTTVMGAALVSFNRRIPFGHVEAGLRTGDLQNPFPEEMNRKVAGILARWHFAPTQVSRDNLLAEGTPAETVHVTGNTVIDALLDIAPRAGDIGVALDPQRKLVLVTAHRRENFGAPMDAACRAIRTLADVRDDVEFLFPVHPNPNVRRSVDAFLLGHPRIHLVEPLDYGPFVAAMRRATLILTDSGGVQEEAPALGKPVLVLREETERPEAVAEGVVALVGCDHDRIVGAVQRLLDDPAAYAAMARGVSPYGDGQAAARIVAILERDAATAR
jgi:UDP-N-acetylglucosamine 2-epimerase (non-hydrolysing)